MGRYKPETAILEITQKCNLHCKHCGSGCNDQAPNELTTKEWIKCLDELCFAGTKRVVFSGGEPMLRGGLPCIIRHARDIGLEYTLISNGFYLPPGILDFFADVRPKAIGVSIDGNEAIHDSIRMRSGSFQSALWSIDAIRSLGIQVTAITTVSRYNLNALDDIISAIIGKVDSWQIQIAMPFGRMRHHENMLLDDQDFVKLCKKIQIYRIVYPDTYIEAADCFGSAPVDTIRSAEYPGCQAGKSAVAVDAQGNVLPCLSLQADFYCGNIKDQGFLEIWNKSRGFDFNRKFQKNAVGDLCVNCNKLRQCRGGCASQSYAFFGIMHNAPYCYNRTFKERG